jgi:WD40 repeat protein
MRIRILVLGVYLVSCTSAPNPKNAPPAAASVVPAIQSREYAGVYLSTPEEDYFTPCGIEGAGGDWSLRFRDKDPRAPFLKKVTANRGYAPLAHFIRVRGTLSAPGNYNIGFQTRELAVDTVLDVKETLEPCAGFGVPAAWSRIPARFRMLSGIALSADRRLAALMDANGDIFLWSTETAGLVRKVGSVTKGDIMGGGYRPMTFSGDGTLLAAGGVDRFIRVWRLRDGKRVFSLPQKDSADNVRELAKIPPDKDAKWNPPPSPNTYTQAQQIVFNKQGTMLAATNHFSTSIWSMKTGKKLAEFGCGICSMTKAFFVGDAGLLLTADGGRFALRSHLDAEPVIRPGTHAGATEHMVASRDGHVFAVNGWGDSVFLWSVAEGPGRALPVPQFVTGAMAFSPDGNTVATSGGMSGLYVWDTRTGAPIKAFRNFPNSLSAAWFTADGKAIVTLSTFDDRFRIVYVDPAARPEGQKIFDDSLTAELPLGPKVTTTPRTIGATVMGPKQRAVAGAEVSISNGDAPDSVIARTTTSSGGYFSFAGIRFRHVLIRVQKPGFAPGVKYIHLARWANEGPWLIELAPEVRPTESGGT